MALRFLLFILLTLTPSTNVWADAATPDPQRLAPDWWSYLLVVWLVPEAVKRPAAVHAAYPWEIETRLKHYSIETPFPQRDLHLRSGLGAIPMPP